MNGKYSYRVKMYEWEIYRSKLMEGGVESRQKEELIEHGVCYRMLKRVVMWCSVLQRVALCCSVLQCVALVVCFRAQNSRILFGSFRVLGVSTFHAHPPLPVVVSSSTAFPICLSKCQPQMSRRLVLKQSRS